MVDAPSTGAAAVPLTLPPHHHHAGILPAVQSLLNVLIVTLFLITFTVQPIRIPSASMEPTILTGDFLLLDRAAAAPLAGLLLPRTQIDRGDVVVFHDPVDPTIHLVKRVIGVPGDRIRLESGVVYRNEQPLHESYAVFRKAARDRFRDDFPTLATMDARVNLAWWIKLRSLVHDGEITVPADNYFVMGDNRNDSEDSRYLGFVPRSAIVGKPLMVYFSYRDPILEPAAEAHSVDLRRGSEWAAQANGTRWNRMFRVVH